MSKNNICETIQLDYKRGKKVNMSLFLVAPNKRPF